MIKKIILFLVAVQGCSSAQKPSVTPVSAKSVKMNQVIDDYFESFLKLYPLFATSIGDHRFDSEMTIVPSDEHRKQELNLVETTLAIVSAMGCNDLNHQDTLTCEAFIHDMQASGELLRTDLGHLMPVDQFSSFFSDFAEIASGSSYVTFNTLQDYKNFEKRMEVVPAYFDVMIANMKLGLKRKVSTPQVLVDQALKQIHALLPKDIHESVFYKPLLNLDQVAKGSDATVVKAQYEDTIKTKVYPAYEKLENYVKNEYRSKARKTHGISKVPGGKKYYLALVKENTTTDLSPDQIHSLGLKEVSRIQAELEDVKKQLGFKGSRDEFFKSIRTDKKLFPFTTSEQVLNAYRAILARVMAQVPAHFRLLPKAKFEIREVEKFKAENASEAYQNGSPDGTRPGVFWVPVPHAEKYGSKDMESLFLHEAIPGHHFQISIQQETDLPRYRRFSGNNAYVEGWALYTEGLGKDLGMYTDPYQWIGRLGGEMHRAIRLVVDTGIHWKGWSREKAIKYSLEHEPADQAGVISEIERYMAIPGQALSYKLGELKILELKNKAKLALGAKYSDQDFHDEILKDGALPLSILDRKISEWISMRAR